MKTFKLSEKSVPLSDAEIQKKHNIILYAVAFLLLFTSNYVFADYVAKATWNFPNTIGEYTGTGSTKENALSNARNSCIQAQALEEWKNFCYNSPASVSYADKAASNYCGDFETPWTRNGDSHPSPCPKDCPIEVRLREEHRIVDFYKDQTKYFKSCFRR